MTTNSGLEEAARRVIYKVANEIANNLNNKTPTHLLALDFEKAYDTLWVKGFIYKLLSMGFSLHICKFLFNYLSNRSYKVEVGNSYSYSYIAQAGTPQGSVLSCLIFILYVSDFPTHEGSLNINISQFADDVLISTSTQITCLAQEELNNYLSKIVQYTNKWKIKINTNKCEEIAVVGNRVQTTRRVRKDCRNIRLYLNNEPLKKTTNLKYLGVYISKNFKFNHHLNYIRTKMLAAFFVLKSIFFNRKINPKVKILAYKQIIKSIALYACPIWLQVSKPQIEIISRLERKMLRACCGLYRRPGSVKYFKNSTLYDKCSINPIQSELINYTIRFCGKLYNNNNLNLREFDNMENLHYYKSKPPAYIYYLANRNELFHNNELMYYRNLKTIRDYRQRV